MAKPPLNLEVAKWETQTDPTPAVVIGLDRFSNEFILANFFLVLGMEHRVSHRLHKCSSTELHA
jgi:hypothetical protein